MTRTSIFILALGAALAFPAVAAASCGTTQGSFSVTCERGVAVYRHNALSGIPASPTAAEASLESEKIRAKTARLSLVSQARANARNAKLRERELALKEYQTRIYDHNTRRRSGVYGTYGARGYSFGQPLRIRSGSLNIKH